jgi:hypothetical protein
MRRLSTGFGIGILTMAFSSLSFAGVGQSNGGPPEKARTGVDSQPGPKNSTGKRSHTPPARVPPAQGEAAPSPQARTRASMQEEAAHEPVPDARTLRLQREESKRIVEERKRAEQRDGEPQPRKLRR